MIKNFLKKIIVGIIRWQAGVVLRKYQPRVVGISGSVGKTGTKEAIAQVLAKEFSVRKSPKSYNSELGVPLTVLDCENAWYSLGGWIKNILEAFSLILFSTKYPEWLVLEVGADRPGDIRAVTEYVRFEIAVLTRLPEVLPHVEFFKSTDQLVNEKLALARAISLHGSVILNHDDPKIMAVAGSLKAKIITYGFGEGAMVRGSQETILYREEGGRRVPDGLTLRVDYQGSTLPFRIRGLLAEHQLYGVLAAIAVGLSVGLNLVEIASALESFEAPPGRFKPIAGIKDSLIIDDSYNASPAAVTAALKTLAKIETTGRRIAVLGDMLELGSFTAEAHRQIGAEAAAVCDTIVTVGLRAKFIQAEAEERKFNKKKLFHFDTAEEAALTVQDLIRPNDVVLVKGSQGIRLEKVVAEIMAHPEDKEKLLVRQESAWKKK